MDMFFIKCSVSRVEEVKKFGEPDFLSVPSWF